MAQFPLNNLISGHPTGSYGDPESGCGQGGQQLGHTKEIISCANQEWGQADSHNSIISCFSESHSGLYPPKTFFHALSDPLTYFIGFMPSGSTINRRSPSPFLIGRHMGSDLFAPQSGHKIMRIISLVGTQDFESDPTTGLPLEHGQSRFLFRNPRGRSY